MKAFVRRQTTHPGYRPNLCHPLPPADRANRFCIHWLAGIANHGLLLDEPVPGNCTACTDHLHILTAPNWTNNDIRNSIQINLPVSASEKAASCPNHYARPPWRWANGLQPCPPLA
jgi:hypothetical protein